MTDKRRQRLTEFVEAATRIFTARGYRRTQMSDVTAAMGLSPGAIYRYVESKEALFDLAVRHAIDPDTPLHAGPGPVPTPEPGSTLAYLRHMAAERAGMPALRAALDGRKAVDPARELEQILREIHRTTVRYRDALSLVERCALDWPDLAEFWFVEFRDRLVENLDAYLRLRGREGRLRPVPHPRMAAHLIVNTHAFLAVDRFHDPYMPSFDDEAAEETAIDFLLHTLLPGSGGTKK